MPNQISDALLNPAFAITVKFTYDGGLFVYRRDRQPDPKKKGGFIYVQRPLGQIPIVNDVQYFELGIGEPGGSRTDIGPALLIARFGDWAAGWDEEKAHVLGGQPFAFGNEPMGVPSTHTPGFPPPIRLHGRFSNPFGPGATLIIEGLQTQTTISITQKVKEKYLSLWLPDGLKGYAKFRSWPGGEKVFDQNS